MFSASHTHKIICVGSTSKDIFFPTDEGLIIQTPDDLVSKEKIAFELGGKIRVADRFEAVGGVAANVSHGLTRLGHTAACYSKIGKDEMGEWILREFQGARVPIGLLSVDEAVKTDLSAIVVLTQNGERTIFHNRDANEKLSITEDNFSAAEWVFVSALNGPWQENLAKLLALKDKRGFFLAFNPGQHNIKEDAKLLLMAIAKTDVLLLNKDEATELVMQMQTDLPEDRLDDETYLLQTLHHTGAKIVGITDGKRGAWGFDGKEYWYCPIHTRRGVVDSTGCGDAFGSGFLAALLEGKSIEHSLRYGIANSGSVVGAYGAIEGLLTREEMQTIVQEIAPERLNENAPR